jgi:PAS domain S-box-containing protein
MPPCDNSDRDRQAGARLRWLEVAQRMSAAVNAAGDLDALLRRLLDEVLAATGAQRGAVFLADATRRELRGRALVGYPPLPPDVPAHANVRPLFSAPHPDEDIYAAVVRSGEQLVVSATHPARHRHNAWGLPAAFRVLTPIKFGDEAIGVFSAVWTDREEASAEDLTLLRLLAEQAGGAVARARLVEAARLAQEQLATGLRNSGTVAYTYDAEGFLDSVVGDVLGVTGWTPDELLGQPILEFTDHMDQARMRELIVRRLHGDNEAWQVETFFRQRSGKVIPVLVAGGPRMVEGRTAGGAGVLTNLQRFAEVQAELQRALASKARAEGAVRTGRAVGHELAGPLASIMGLVSLLVDDPRLPADVVYDLRLMGTEVDRAAELLRHFASITRYAEMPTPAGPQLDVRRAADGGEHEAG